MFKAFIFISHFLDLHREQQKIAKSATFFVTNFLFITHLVLLSKDVFVKNSCLKQHFVIRVRHLYTVKPSDDKINTT